MDKKIIIHDGIIELEFEEVTLKGKEYWAVEDIFFESYFDNGNSGFHWNREIYMWVKIKNGYNIFND